MIMLLRKALLLLVLVEGVVNSLSYVLPNAYYSRSVNTRLNHYPNCASTPLFAMKKCENNSRIMSMDKPSPHLPSSSLFPSRGTREEVHRFDFSSKASVSPNNEDDDQSIFEKVWAPFGRLKALITHVLKLIFVIPLRKLKSILTKKGKDAENGDIDDLNPENASVEEVKVMAKDTSDDSKKERVLKVAVEWTKETIAVVEEMNPSSVNGKEDVDEVVEDPIISLSAPPMENDVLEDNEEKTSNSAYTEETRDVISEQMDAIEDNQQEEGEDIENQQVKTEMFVESKKENIAQNELGAANAEASDDVTEHLGEDTSIALAGEEQQIEAVQTLPLPKGDRWAVAAPGIDLTGKWKIVASDAFKSEYDAYLRNLGQPSLVRSVAVSIVEMTTEEVIQSDDGRELCIKGKNLRGIWERTLIASGSDFGTSHGDDIEHTQVPLVTADKENVVAETWWEKNGTVNRSWLRGVKKYGGGDFESRRFLTDDGNRLVCESEFHPQGREKDKAVITWTFERVDS